MYVSRNYLMDPETEDLLIDGHLLQNDMVVLIAEDNWRAPVDNYTGQPKAPQGGDLAATTANANRYNRWMKVTQVRRNEHTVTFIGEYIYDGGYKLFHKISLNEAWYVKLNTVVEEQVPDDYSLGFKRGKRFGRDELKKEFEKDLVARYYQGFADGVKAFKSAEDKSPKVGYNGVPLTEMAKDYDPPIFNNFINSNSNHPNLKSFYMYEDDLVLQGFYEKPNETTLKKVDVTETPEGIQIKETVEEEKSDAVIQAFAKVDPEIVDHGDGSYTITG